MEKEYEILQEQYKMLQIKILRQKDELQFLKNMVSQRVKNEVKS